MPQLKRLAYPTELIDKNILRLQRVLRRIYRQYRQHTLNKSQAVADGDKAINEAYQRMEQDIKDFLHKRGLRYDGDRSELLQGLQEQQQRWRRIVDRF